MSLEDTAKEITQQIQNITQQLQYILRLCQVVQLKFIIEDTVISLTLEQKQKLIDEYKKVKTKIKKLVEGLP